MTQTRPAPTWIRFARLIHERFPLKSHLPMVVAFSFANMAAAQIMRSGSHDWGGAIVACAVALLFFLRLRLFDELKDRREDAVVNPDRPLARGLVTPGEVHVAVVFGIVLEVLLVVVFARPAVVAYGIALAFSLLMFREFFIGRFIRPHLTTYAVMHTFVAILLGIAVASVAERAALGEFPRQFLLFGVVNWAVFNVFEFARKTFASEEERAGVDTYSSIFSPVGAILLSISQLVAVVVATSMLGGAILLSVQVALAVGLFATMIYYVTKRNARGARTYRATAGAYIVAAYAGFALVGF